MPGHFSPPEANFYCTMVFVLLAEVSFNFISCVGIATLCCLRYWGAPPQRGPSPDCLSCGSNCTNDQPPTSTMDNGPVPQSPALDKTRNRHATCHPLSLFCTFSLLRPCQRTAYCTVCCRRWLRTIGELSPSTASEERGQHDARPTSTRSRAPLATSRQPDRRIRTMRVALTHSRSLSAN